MTIDGSYYHSNVGVFDDKRAREAAFQAALAASIKPGMSAEQCARNVGYVCAAFAYAEGQKPEIEVSVRGPADHHYAGKCWVANWEAGPYEWGIPASYALGDAGNRLVEPYYSFDVCFYDDE